MFDVNIFLDGQSEDFENRSILVTYGLTIEELPIPTKEHYVFTGWYTSKNGVEVLVHDGEKFTKNYNVISADRYTIVDDKVTLYAKYQIETIPVTFVYTNNGIDKQETIRIPYEGKIMDYAPSIINQYNEKSGFCWTLSPTDSIEKEIFVAVEEMTLYAVGSYIKFQNKYTAIESIDKSELLVDFRTSSSTNINAVYTVSSDLKRVIFIGDPSKTYTNFSIVVSASGERFELNLVDFKYSAQPRTVGLDASNLSNNSVLVINARGNAEIRGGDGKDGSSGASYDINNATKSPRSGGPGNNGESGSQALVCNNIEINIAINGSLKLFGGNGGDGGNGGHGEGSASDGIAQCGHGGNGGHGGAGGNAIEIRYKLVLNSLGNFSATGGNGADGGSGGNGGNNKDTGAFDRADHGGHGADGGNGGKGGVGIYINQNVLVEVINSSTIFATGGNGGKGGSGGSGGKSCKNEFQSSDGGNPGDAGSGGQGGMGGNSINYNDLSVIRKGGSGGYGGSAGTPGSAHNKIGEQGTDRSQTQASNGN